MPVPFDITTPTNSVRLRADLAGEAVFTVFNRSGRPLRARPRLGAISLQKAGEGGQPTPDLVDKARAWVQINDADERDMSIADTEEYVIPIVVPKAHGLVPGSYQCQFRLDMVGVENPDEDYAEGPTVAFEVVVSEPVIPWWKRYWWALAAGGALLVIGVVLVIVLTGQGVEVPDVTGQTLAEANAILTGARLQVGGSTDEPSETWETGRIIRSNPEAGIKVKRDSSVALVLSSGPAPVTLPDVDDRLEADAKRLLEEACAPQPCVVVQVIYEKSDEVGKGRVIRSDPAGGSQVQRGSTVSLVVASGPATVSVPTVTSQTEANATTTLQQACEPQPCLNVKVVREVSNTVTEGRAIRTDPAAGTRVATGSEVTLVIAQAPPAVSKTIVADADIYFDPPGMLYIIGQVPDFGHEDYLSLSNQPALFVRDAQGLLVVHFDLTGISSKARVEQATLALYLTKTSDEKAHNVIAEPASGSWTEDSIDRPACDAGFQVTAKVGGTGYQEWDVTKIVAQQVSGGLKNFGICLVIPVDDQSTLVFTSREGATRQRPMLRVTYRQ